MKDRKKHVFVTELECMSGIERKIDEMSLMLDIKVLINEFFLATFVENGEALKIEFTNGQKFLLSVKEIK